MRGRHRKGRRKGRDIGCKLYRSRRHRWKKKREPRKKEKEKEKKKREGLRRLGSTIEEV